MPRVPKATVGRGDVVQYASHLPDEGVVRGHPLAHLRGEVRVRDQGTVTERGAERSVNLGAAGDAKQIGHVVRRDAAAGQDFDAAGGPPDQFGEPCSPTDLDRV